MTEPDREFHYARTSTEANHLLGCNGNIHRLTACLIAVSQTEAELTYNVLSGFSSIIRALLDNFVLPTIAQMTTWVSRRYFMTAFR